MIACNRSDHGRFGLTTREACRQGRLEDCEYPVKMVEEAMTRLPKVPAMV